MSAPPRAVERDTKSMGFAVGKHNVPLVYRNNPRIAYQPFWLMMFIFYHADDGNGDADRIQKALDRPHVRFPPVYDKDPWKRPFGVPETPREHFGQRRNIIIRNGLNLEFSICGFYHLPVTDHGHDAYGLISTSMRDIICLDARACPRQNRRSAVRNTRFTFYQRNIADVFKCIHLSPQCRRLLETFLRGSGAHFRREPSLETVKIAGEQVADIPYRVRTPFLRHFAGTYTRTQTNLPVEARSTCFIFFAATRYAFRISEW